MFFDKQDEEENISEDSRETLADRAHEKNRRQRHKVGFYYSFLTIVLLFCLIQIGFGAILNISKTIAYQSKVRTLKKIRDTAEQNNKNLKQEINVFSTTTSLEGIARNNLKMAGEDEVLILISNKPEEKEKDKKEKQ